MKSIAVEIQITGGSIRGVGVCILAFFESKELRKQARKHEGCKDARMQRDMCNPSAQAGPSVRRFGLPCHASSLLPSCGPPHPMSIPSAQQHMSFDSSIIQRKALSSLCFRTSLADERQAKHESE
jgi:hypothetical protein